MNIVHLTDSPFLGGPERQMLGLAQGLPVDYVSTFLCFNNGNDSCAPFLGRLNAAGVAARMLKSRNPNFAAITLEVRRELTQLRADVLVTHGYKADTLGLLAGRSCGLPVISVSRGWTAHTRKVRMNEALDRRALRWMDAVVCVSEGQARKVRRSGVAAERVSVIRNAIDSCRFDDAGAGEHNLLQSFFQEPVDAIVCAVGRLSPEKGFEQLVAAAEVVVRARPETGFVILGEGPSRASLETAIAQAGLGARFVLPGFRSDVDQLLPHADILALSSYTEGLPNVILEASAAGVPVVATNVGGTPEVVEEGVNGLLVPVANPERMAHALLGLLASPAGRKAMGARGREHVRTRFSFAAQIADYQRLFGNIVRPRGSSARVTALSENA